MIITQYRYNISYGKIPANYEKKISVSQKYYIREVINKGVIYTPILY